MESHCETMWAYNSGAYLVQHPAADHGMEPHGASYQTQIDQQRLRYKVLSLWIKNSLTKLTKTQVEGLQDLIFLQYPRLWRQNILCHCNNSTPLYTRYMLRH